MRAAAPDASEDDVLARAALASAEGATHAVDAAIRDAARARGRRALFDAARERARRAIHVVRPGAQDRRRGRRPRAPGEGCAC
ncbi:hypothetical protein D512_22556 [Burkholderia pseudomallei MSHR1043]|nr:hypothetical protein D512_22556 [Burkholderia pseudomallei MSHR1043]OMT55908.1 hypothetical protein AQ760_14275 [Burkholderia pseudomallei]OMZ25951.1 hypothetical protein AQ859_25195 [Burkholderia pseudomallei]OMZ30940.1 hypothetical protein AQ860_21520 [Burkholderia pseudomallei]ONA08248.1 hypothetical protein AQ875_24400 [Burkholderia pseudomallei]